MGRAHMNGPPPGVLDGACDICLLRAKQRQFEAYAEELKAVWAEGGDVVKWLAWIPGLEADIFKGIVHSVSATAPALGKLWLCWDDVAGIEPTPPIAAELDTTTKLPPGLIKGTR